MKAKLFEKIVELFQMPVGVQQSQGFLCHICSKSEWNMNTGMWHRHQQGRGAFTEFELGNGIVHKNTFCFNDGAAHPADKFRSALR